jgi:hypothetical protein
MQLVLKTHRSKNCSVAIFQHKGKMSYNVNIACI